MATDNVSPNTDTGGVDNATVQQAQEQAKQLFLYETQINMENSAIKTKGQTAVNTSEVRPD